MATSEIEPDRIHHRRTESDSDRAGDGDVVCYWMQSAQRAEHNPALEHAVRTANDRGLPAAVLFCLVDDYPEASRRHYAFMLEGLASTAEAVERRGIRFEVLRSHPGPAMEAVGHRIAHLVTDVGPLPVQRRWRDEVADAYAGPIDEVECDVVVPPHLVSDKHETAARTIRPKINRHRDDFLVELRTTALDRTSVTGGSHPVSLARTAGDLPTADLGRWRALVDELDAADEPGPVDGWPAGTAAARSRLRTFCTEVLPRYSEQRNRYDRTEAGAELSPYLHFGQISPVAVAVEALDADAPDDEKEAFLEELIVRRELAVNHARHVTEPGSFSALPDWARQTLRDHADDDRPGVVTADQLEAGETGDEVWNTIMDRIRTDGWVHNQLRMYWGKQILNWTNTPEHAFRTLLSLNNRFFLDGRDANSYANVGWCFGLHDQPFQERDVFGKVRPFTDQALRRKGDLDAWLDRNGEPAPESS